MRRATERATKITRTSDITYQSSTMEDPIHDE